MVKYTIEKRGQGGQGSQSGESDHNPGCNPDRGGCSMPNPANVPAEVLKVPQAVAAVMRAWQMVARKDGISVEQAQEKYKLSRVNRGEIAYGAIGAEANGVETDVSETYTTGASQNSWIPRLDPFAYKAWIWLGFQVRTLGTNIIFIETFKDRVRNSLLAGIDVYSSPDGFWWMENPEVWSKDDCVPRMVVRVTDTVLLQNDFPIAYVIRPC